MAEGEPVLEATGQPLVRGGARALEGRRGLCAEETELGEEAECRGCQRRCRQAEGESESKREAEWQQRSQCRCGEKGGLLVPGGWRHEEGHRPRQPCTYSQSAAPFQFDAETVSEAF